MRGYFGIGVFHPKNGINIGTLWRSAHIFGAAFIFTIGRRYKTEAADVLATPRHVPLLHYSTTDDFRAHIPNSCRVICVENNEGAAPLNRFVHPERAIYLLGAEDHGLPEEILARCQSVIIESACAWPLNVATAGSIVMYDRFVKEAKTP